MVLRTCATKICKKTEKPRALQTRQVRQVVKQLTLGVQTCLSHLSPGVYEFGTNAASSAGLAGWASCCTRSHHPSHLARALILSLPLFRAMPLGRRRLLLPLSSAALAIIVRVLYSFFFPQFFYVRTTCPTVGNYLDLKAPTGY